MNKYIFLVVISGEKRKIERNLSSDCRWETEICKLAQRGHKVETENSLAMPSPSPPRQSRIFKYGFQEGDLNNDTI